jgi:uncharacterized membrane protein
MKLRPIDKNRYRKHYKIVFAAIVIALIAISLGCSKIVIALIAISLGCSNLSINWLSSPDEPHFTLNLAGFVVAILSVAYTVYRLRDHPFMNEVVYVWNLKNNSILFTVNSTRSSR